MAGMITRCPKCATAFRISDAHLESAQGKVRCGHCLDVFNAKLYIQTEDAIDGASALGAEALSPQSAAKEATVLTSTTQKSSRSNPAIIDDADESWALELLKDDTDLNIQLKKIVPIEKKEAANAPQDNVKPKNHDSQEEPIKAEARLSTRELLKQKGLKRKLTKSKPEKSPYTKIRKTKASSSQDNSNSTPLNEDKGKTPNHKTEQAAKNSRPHAVSGTHSEITNDSGSNNSIDHMLAAIEPDALEVDWVDEKTRRKRLLIWSSLSLAAGILLCIQVAWLQFHKLNRVEPYRTAYGMVCSVFGCVLPTQKNLRAIETSNLVVRSHPSKQNALMVDVILQNNADFEQTFPGILLTFSDLAAKPVAARRFTAQDYLGGELAGASHMPIKQPIHIAIEIQDPGVSALSYNIAVVD